MKKMYSESENWNNKNWKKSFENLSNDNYSFDSIKFEGWLKLDNWKLSVLCSKTAHKIIKETEKAICFSVVNQYGNMYEMWFPKSALISF